MHLSKLDEVNKLSYLRRLHLSAIEDVERRMRNPNEKELIHFTVDHVINFDLKTAVRMPVYEAIIVALKADIAETEKMLRDLGVTLPDAS